MKRAGVRKSRLGFMVAPRRGAWIETHNVRKIFHKRRVAPGRGAWIETIEK